MCLPGTQHTIHGFPDGWSRSPTQHLSGRGRQRPLGILPTPYSFWAEKSAPGFSQKTDVSIEVTSPAGAGRAGQEPRVGTRMCHLCFPRVCLVPEL